MRPQHRPCDRHWVKALYPQIHSPLTLPDEAGGLCLFCKPGDGLRTRTTNTMDPHWNPGPPALRGPPCLC